MWRVGLLSTGNGDLVAGHVSSVSAESRACDATVPRACDWRGDNLG